MLIRMSFLLVFSMIVQSQLTMASESKSFLTRVFEQITECPSLDCDEPVDLRRAPLTTELDAKTKDFLNVAMRRLVNIWGDTILEGDYASKTEEASITEVEAIVNKDGTLEGYYITFAAPSWYTGECEINEDAESDEEMFADCDKISISESAFVSVDGQEYDGDPDAYAQDDM